MGQKPSKFTLKIYYKTQNSKKKKKPHKIPYQTTNHAWGSPKKDYIMQFCWKSYLMIYPHFGGTCQERKHHGTQETGNPREKKIKWNIQRGGHDDRS